jgi:hypothetical protein
MHHAECDAPKCECDEWDKKLPPTRDTIVVWLPQINRAENSEQNDGFVHGTEALLPSYFVVALQSAL